jgi:hypothetical protein
MSRELVTGPRATGRRPNWCAQSEACWQLIPLALQSVDAAHGTRNVPCRSFSPCRRPSRASAAALLGLGCVPRDGGTDDTSIHIPSTSLERDDRERFYCDCVCHATAYVSYSYPVILLVPDIFESTVEYLSGIAVSITASPQS